MLKQYVLWYANAGAPVAAADVALETDARGRHMATALRYRQEYLLLQNAVDINPVHAPLSDITYEWRTPEIPAVLDDLVPGLWERKVLARWREEIGDKRDVEDLHALFESRTYWPIGAFKLCPNEVHPCNPPEYRQVSGSHWMDMFGDILLAFEAINTNNYTARPVLQNLKNGSSLGGARPKVLTEDAEHKWIAKYSTQYDAFDYVHVEHACLNLAKACGLQAADSRVETVDGKPVLLVKRFDITETNALPLYSVNSLLKDADTQRDLQQPSYNHLISLIRQYSQNVSGDLQQLFGQMLFNNCINNRDDHLRNFSFLGGRRDLGLSPAYDLVPSDTVGAYPQLSFNHSIALPSLSDAINAGKSFNLTPKESTAVAEQISEAMQNWEAVFKQAGVSEDDLRLMRKLIRQR